MTTYAAITDLTGMTGAFAINDVGVVLGTFMEINGTGGHALEARGCHAYFLVSNITVLTDTFWEGVYITDSSNWILENVTVIGVTTAVVISGSSDIVLANSTIGGTPPNGVSVSYSQRISVLNSTFNSLDYHVVEGGTVSGNVFNGTPAFFPIWQSPNLTLEGNSFSAGGIFMRGYSRDDFNHTIGEIIISPRAPTSRRCETQAPLGGQPPSFATVSVP